MNHRVSPWLVMALVAAVPALAQPPGPNRTILTDTATAPIAGVWRSDADPQGAVSVSAWGDGQVSMRAGKRFDAVGYFREGEFVGLTREPGTPDSTTGRVTHGFVRVRLRDDGTAVAEFSPGVDEPATRRETWRLEGRFGKPAASAPQAPSDSLPVLGDYVQVEELPEVISRFPPEYPEEAKRRKIDGTVMVQALVGKDGGVKKAVVVKSIPELNDAATECIRLWRFKPALFQGKPVAVWVAVPVTFRLR